MALADPQGPITITGLPGSPYTLYRVTTGDFLSVYQTADEVLKLTVSHKTTSKGRVIHEMRWDLRKIVTDPLVVDKSDWESTTFRTVIDRPGYGFTETDIKNGISAVQAWQDGTFIGKIYGKQS